MRLALDSTQREWELWLTAATSPSSGNLSMETTSTISLFAGIKLNVWITLKFVTWSMIVATILTRTCAQTISNAMEVEISFRKQANVTEDLTAWIYQMNAMTIARNKL